MPSPEQPLQPFPHSNEAAVARTIVPARRVVVPGHGPPIPVPHGAIPGLDVPANLDAAPMAAAVALERLAAPHVLRGAPHDLRIVRVLGIRPA